MKVGKPTSKRVPVRLRHKIAKASSAKQRKDRKEAKKNPQWQSRLKKDPGVPNLFPYKAKVLAEIEEGKRRKIEEANRRREVARAQREGRVEAGNPGANGDGKQQGEGEDDDDVLIDYAEEVEGEDEDVEAMDERDSANPMAALLASAEARARAFAPQVVGDNVAGSDEEEDAAEDEDDWDGIADSTSANTSTKQPTSTSHKALPQSVIADPIKAVARLLDRMQTTTDGIERLLEYYHAPPLVSSAAATTTGAGDGMSARFLVEVARKRGRLGKGGVPNLHSAALVVLGDLNDGRLVLPAAASAVKTKKVEVTRSISEDGKGKVEIVAEMARPFRIEGLWGNEEETAGDEGMVVER